MHSKLNKSPTPKIAQVISDLPDLAMDHLKDTTESSVGATEENIDSHYIDNETSNINNSLEQELQSSSTDQNFQAMKILPSKMYVFNQTYHPSHSKKR